MHTLVAGFRYDWPVDKLIQSFKYRTKLQYGRALARLLVPAIEAAYGQSSLPMGIIPMPLHRKRQAERGFNQALELAQPLGQALDIPLLSVCTRRLHRPAQVRKRRTLPHAFVCTGEVPAHVAIVDDVVTTGATVAALRRALPAQTRVDVWCVARALSGRLS